MDKPSHKFAGSEFGRRRRPQDSQSITPLRFHPAPAPAASGRGTKLGHEAPDAIRNQPVGGALFLYKSYRCTTQCGRLRIVTNFLLTTLSFLD